MRLEELEEGLQLAPGYLDQQAQLEILRDIRSTVASAPLYTPVMPRSGRPFSVQMSNCGPLGWVSDRAGYRYQENHPVTGQRWPDLPDPIKAIWQALSGYGHPAECCLINFYRETARMGLHRDENEDAFDAPVVSISLGDRALFRFGGTERGGRTQSVKLNSGDVLIMGGPARLCYHGIDRIYPGTSPLLQDGGRLNLTLRRVTLPGATAAAQA